MGGNQKRVIKLIAAGIEKNLLSFMFHLMELGIVLLEIPPFKY